MNQTHTIHRLNGEADPIELPAQLSIITESWNRVVAVPYIVYMPEKNRILMLVSCDYPPIRPPVHYAMVLRSDDLGATWTEPRYVHVDSEGNCDTGMGTALTYMGGGKVCLSGDGRYWLSNDFGDTWSSDVMTNPPVSDGHQWGEWDPLLVDRDPKTGEVLRLMTLCSDYLGLDGVWQGHVRFSHDEGRTWSTEIKVPQMHNVDEAAFIRAANGDIVAACRTGNPARFKDEIDHYGGLSVSVSKDDGYTWSERYLLYEWGRHHPSMVLMPSGDIVMTYVVRKGYTDADDGLPHFGIEAIVSRDNGETWDMDHRYILDTWKGNRTGPNAWWASSQATSSVLLPDGYILTAFGTGYRSQPDANNLPAPRDVGLVWWRPI